MNTPHPFPCSDRPAPATQPPTSLLLPSRVLGVAIFVFAGVGHAADQVTTGCPEQALQAMVSHAAMDASPDVVGQRLSAVVASEPQCLRSAVYYRARAQLRRATGQLALALEDTERALLLDPDHPGTQLDHAQLLLALGDVASASVLLGQIAQRPDVPEPLSGPISQLQARLVDLQVVIADAPAIAVGPDEILPADAWVTKWQLSQSVGRDSNINRAPGGKTLTLTLPDGDANFALGDESLPRASSILQTQLQGRALRGSGAAVWVLDADLRHRHAPDPADRFAQIDVGASWLQAPRAQQQWVWQTQMSGSVGARRGAYVTLRSGLQHQWSLGYCAPSFGVELEGRRYPEAVIQNGAYAGAVLGVVCGPWLWQWRQGVDRPINSARPGGPQQQQDARWAWRGRSGPHGWTLEHRWQHQSDGDGYSPLLADNAPRRVRRQALQAEWYTHAPIKNAQVFVQVEWSRQRSNLALFAFTQHRVQAGLRWTVE